MRSVSYPGITALFVVLFSFIAFAPLAMAATDSDSDRTGAPEELYHWKDWLLHGQERHFCPSMSQEGGGRVCAFPSDIDITTSKDGANFTMQVHVYARERVILPYGKDIWPQEVEFNDQNGFAVSALVLEHQDRPSVMLEPGDYTIFGFLPWSEQPEILQLPANVGLVGLTRPEGVEPCPNVSETGELRLASKASVGESPADGLEVEIFRLVDDSLPMRVHTLLRLQISGRARRIELSKVLPTNSEPLAVESPLPLSFTPNDGVYIQGRPGSFDVYITSRLSGQVDQLGPQPAPYGREFWAFKANEDLRVVEVHGAPDVDPKTTDLPRAWQQYPAYMVEPQTVVLFKETHRGAPDAAPDSLQISRSIWLDFDGNGVTVRDAIAGSIRRDWTLRMIAPGELGRASVKGEDQPVVLLGEDMLPGVELRKGDVSLTTESRYTDFSGTLPSTGWDREFDKVEAVLHLPPGWRLLTAQGMDGVNDSWFSRWTFLDILLCLLITLAVGMFHSWWLGILALVFLALGFHEPNAPKLIWLYLLGALALVKVFHTQARLKDYHTGRQMALALYASAVIVMAVIVIPYIYGQVRSGIYPQLERVPYKYQAARGGGSYLGAEAPAPSQVAEEPMEMEAMEKSDFLSQAPTSRSMMKLQKQQKAKAPKALMYDPEALVQTGPGVPDWNWRDVTLTWNGPVARGESIQLTLLSPFWGLLLSGARVILLVVVFLLLVDIRALVRGFTARFPVKDATAGVLVLLALTFTLLSAAPAMATRKPLPPQNQQENTQLSEQIAPIAPSQPELGQGSTTVFPPSWLLDEYRRRLLEEDPCYPDCQSSPHLDVQVDDQKLRLIFTVHAGADTAVALPVISDRWQAATVLLDEKPAKDLFREQGRLYCAVTPGVHRITMEGPTPKGLSFQISLPLQSRQGFVRAPGWIVQGRGGAGEIQGSLRLAREKAEEGAGQTPTETYRIPPFLKLTRTITLGLQWTVTTTLERISPTGEPVHLQVPLLPGESVLSEDVKVKDAMAKVQLNPGQRSLTWNSSLERGNELTLKAPQDVPWVETWQLAPSNIWHLDIKGIPAVSILDSEGNWQPSWRPWPGESVTVAVSRPEAASGQAMTINSAELTMRPGQRLDQNELLLRIRASKGLRHVITLPSDAELTGLSASGRDLPLVAGEPGSVEIPIHPGVQEIRISWRQPSDSVSNITPPRIDLGHPAVNANIHVQVPQDRWILLTLGGPILSPAVTYWPYLVAAMIFAWLLHFMPWTPLKLWQWFLLAVGLSQLTPIPALLAVAWLPVLGIKREKYPSKGWFLYDVQQLALLALVAAGMVCFYMAVERGLLGVPFMQVAGNGSYGNELIWTQDRIQGLMPTPSVHTVPLWVYRVVMLTWSLWLAISLLKWLRWGWDCMCEGELFRKPIVRPRQPMPFRNAAQPQAPAAPQDDLQDGAQEDFLLEDDPERKK